MARRVAAQHAALAALARQERRTRAVAEAGALTAWRAAPHGAILEGHGWRALTGQDEAALRGEGWLDALHPDDRAAAAAAWALARAEQRAVDVEYRIRHIGTDDEWRWVRARGVPVRSAPDGPIEEWVGVVEDAHQRRSQEERQALLAREVDHRAKNALAVVQAALRLTRAPDVPAYIRAVEGRVAALARAHTLLAEDGWKGADLRAIVAGELAPFLGAPGQGPRAVLEGPEVGLPALAAQPLGMAVHELATNAVKHGALSAPEGRVAVTWRLEPGRCGRVLRLRWVESGGPPVAGAPERRGFGSRVLEGTLRSQLGGSVELAWAAAGLTCEISVPLRSRAAKAA
jgi:PAS domain S-box-containing protein